MRIWSKVRPPRSLLEIPSSPLATPFARRPRRGLTSHESAASRASVDQPSSIQGILMEINQLENAADRLLEQALTTLFDQPRDLGDFIKRLKWR